MLSKLESSSNFNFPKFKSIWLIEAIEQTIKYLNGKKFGKKKEMWTTGA